MTTNDFISDLYSRLGGIRKLSSNATRTVVESMAGKMIEFESTEPDPTTYRDNYYYNTTHNTLYKRVMSVNKPFKGKIIAHWQRISE